MHCLDAESTQHPQLAACQHHPNDQTWMKSFRSPASCSVRSAYIQAPAQYTDTSSSPRSPISVRGRHDGVNRVWLSISWLLSLRALLKLLEVVDENDIVVTPFGIIADAGDHEAMPARQVMRDKVNTGGLRHSKIMLKLIT